MSAPDVPADLPSRIVFSLLRAPVKLAARLGLPLGTVVQLLRVAYYQELRAAHPRDRRAIANKLGVSLRTAAGLAKQLRDGFLEPEQTVMFSRDVRALIDRRPRTPAEVAEELGVEVQRVQEVLDVLEANGWTSVDDSGRWSIDSVVQSYVGGSPARRVDGLNRQQDLVARAAFAAFFEDGQPPTTARTWVFHADPREFADVRENAMAGLRSEIFALDEASERSVDAGRFGVSVVFSRMDE